MKPMRVHVTVKGRVQGIGYRYFVIETARRFSLTGWVRNCSNGDVESEAQGSRKSINDFLNRLENGHRWARVDGIDQEQMPQATGEKGFDIRF